MLKNPSPSPNWSDGLRIVQSRPDARDERLGLGLRARVVEVRVVLDAHRAHVDEPPDARRLHRRDDRSGALGVDQAQVRAAVEVARDGDEVDDGIDAGQRRRERRRAGDVADPELDARALGGREPAEDDLAGRRRPDERDDPMAGREQGRARCGCRRSRWRR